MLFERTVFMILYFSGTGNSKYIADILAERLGENAVSANELIKSSQTAKQSVGERLIFVSPVYAWRLPRVFQGFIEKSGLKGRAYFVITCGDSICNAQKHLAKFCKKTRLELMGVRQIVMPENYIAMFSVPPKEEIPKLLSTAKAKALSLAESILNEEKLPPVKANLLGKFLSSKLVNGGFYTFCVSAKKFYATEKCISCGKCEKACMLNNITVKDGKPVWGNNCTHCMACICGCPALAIEYGKKTKDKDRYLCPSNKN